MAHPVTKINDHLLHFCKNVTLGFFFFSFREKYATIREKGGITMGKCIVFCAGALDALAQPVEKEDYIIAADGGVIHTNRLGITPDAVLGDFDSLGYVPAGAQVFPVEKDDTDAMLAVRHGLDRGYREFVLYGALEGDRLDHTLANYQLLQFLKDHGADGYLVGKNLLVTLISNEKLRFLGHPKGLISLFCLGKDAHGIDLTGLKYPLADGTLTAGFPLGTGNSFLGCDACVSVKSGSLLALYSKENGFGLREK